MCKETVDKATKVTSSKRWPLHVYICPTCLCIRLPRVREHVSCVCLCHQWVSFLGMLPSWLLSGAFPACRERHRRRCRSMGCVPCCTRDVRPVLLTSLCLSMNSQIQSMNNHTTLQRHGRLLLYTLGYLSVCLSVYLANLQTC